MDLLASTGRLGLMADGALADIRIAVYIPVRARTPPIPPTDLRIEEGKPGGENLSQPRYLQRGSRGTSNSVTTDGRDQAPECVEPRDRLRGQCQAKYVVTTETIPFP
ncbi:MAG: hypothetical protein Q9191_004231 [Dirinaria sp. TL-2023a]